MRAFAKGNCGNSQLISGTCHEERATQENMAQFKAGREDINFDNFEQYRADGVDGPPEMERS